MQFSVKEGEDYYIENGLYVFTEKFHLKRGYCCGSRCRHCPYDAVKEKKKIAVSWSGGKDSTLALFYLLQDKEYHISHLFTVFDKELKRVGLHGIPENLIDRQVAALGFPLKKLYLPASSDHNAYNKLMREYYAELKEDGINDVMFGDIFLEDLKAFRDGMLKNAGLKGRYPIWQKDPEKLVRLFIDKGFKTVVCAADSEFFNSRDLGKTIDHGFIDNLPAGVDSCGENGEYHTFVYEGPIFREPVTFQKGEVISKTYHYTIIKENGDEQEQAKTFLFQELI